MDTGGQALDIFPHSPESVQMMVLVKSYIHSHVHSHSPIHTLKITQEQNEKLTKPEVFTSRPLPLLLLSHVVANIRQGCYLLVRAGLLRTSSLLRQYLKKQFVDVLNKNSNIHEQHCPF